MKTRCLLAIPVYDEKYLTRSIIGILRYLYDVCMHTHNTLGRVLLAQLM